MQSFQTGGGASRDLVSYQDFAHARSMESSPEKPLIRPANVTSLGRDYSRDLDNFSPEKSPTKINTPAPYTKESGRLTSSIRTCARPPPKSILGENTPPPSATMLAIQNMPTTADPSPPEPLSNPAGSSSLVRSPQSYEVLSTQILSLTSIATNMQREMAQLSRRSKDNATDLVSLKEATNARDEDIRQSLRELVTNLSSRITASSETHLHPNSHQANTGPENFLLDDKPHASPPAGRTNRGYILPRIPSPNSFSAALERELASSPSPFGLESGASLALLEKILREMGTKEGQDRLLAAVSRMTDKPDQGNVETTKRLDEITTLVKAVADSQALVKRGQQDEEASRLGVQISAIASTVSGPLIRARREGAQHDDTGKAVDSKTPPSNPTVIELSADEVQKLLKRLKDSVTENGGLTAEVKALVRELRGEVLGMGREMGRKLDQVGSSATGERSMEGNEKDEMTRIVREGLAELRDHLYRAVKDQRRQSGSSVASRSTVDSGEIHNAVRHVIGELQLQRQMGSDLSYNTIDKEEILEAVREGWEAYRPEIASPNYVLERNEILQCLKQGLEEHRSRSNHSEDGVLSRQDILDAVRAGLDDFTLPPVVTVTPEPSITREEILRAVRQSLETFEFPRAAPAPSKDVDIRADVVDAVKEGLGSFNLPRHGDRDGVTIPMRDLGQEVLDRLQHVIEGMRVEFKGVSDEAKQNVAANGRDTEQVLDALKDGLEHLRSDIELHVDRAADMTGKDEIIETMRDGFGRLRIDLESAIIENAPTSSMDETLEDIKGGIDQISDTTTKSLQRVTSINQEETVEVLRRNFRDGFEKLKADLKAIWAAEKPALSDIDEALDNVKEEIAHLRETIATSILRSGSSMSAHDEIIEIIRQSVDELRSELVQKNDRAESVMSGTGEILDALQEGLETLRSEIDKIAEKSAESNIPTDVVDALRNGIVNIRSDIHDLRDKDVTSERAVDTTASDEILDTLKDGVTNIRADIDRLYQMTTEAREISPERGQVVVADDGLKRNDIQNLEVLIAQLRIKVEALDAEAGAVPPQQPVPAEGVAMKEVLSGMEQKLREIEANIAAMAERTHERDSSSTARKEDVDAIETLLINTKAKIDEMKPTDPDLIASKDDVDAIHLLLRDAKDVMDEIVTKVDSGFAKTEDVIAVELLIKELKVGLEELKDRSVSEPSLGESITKTDLDAIEELCVEMKRQMDDMVIPDFETLADKAQLESISGLIKEERDRARQEAELASKAADEAKIDNAEIGERMSEIRGFLEQLQEDLSVKLDERNESIEAIGKILSGLEEVGEINATVGADVKEVMEMVAREFDRSHGIGEGLKSDQDQKTSEVLQKLDERFDEIMTKYDDSQFAQAETQKLAQIRAERNDQLVEGMKAVADDLKLSSDTLGMTITESVDKMAQDSKTVFNRVEDTYGKADETQLEARAGFEETNTKLDETLRFLDSLHKQLGDHQPQAMTSLKDILSIARQHFEHSQRQAAEASRASSAPLSEELKSMIKAPSEKYDDAEVHNKLDKLITHATAIGHDEIHGKLDTLITHATANGHDEIHGKLDKLVDHAANATPPSAQIEVLDQIHRQVIATAEEVTAYFASQSRITADEHEGKMKQAEEARVALERADADRAQVAREVAGLVAQKASLQEAVDGLTADKDGLVGQKTRLAADVASLETARKLRHEELATLEGRAEALERRILEGIIDHSRALLISRSSKDPDEMSLKRVPKRTSNGVAELPSSAVSMALKARPPPIRMAAMTSPSSSGRRILSLNQITGNLPTGGHQAFSYRPRPIRAENSGLGNLKRSHSVKTGSGAGSLRKHSLGGRGRFGLSNQADKENDVFTEDGSEITSPGQDSELDYDDDDDDESEDARTETATTVGHRTSDSGTLERQSSTATLLSSGTGTMMSESLVEFDHEDDSEDEDDSFMESTSELDNRLPENHHHQEVVLHDAPS